MPITKSTPNIIKGNIKQVKNLLVTSDGSVTVTNLQVFFNGISNGKNSYAGNFPPSGSVSLSYTGTRWQLFKDDGENFEYVYANLGNENEPWLAAWPSGTTLTLTDFVQNTNCFIGDNTMKEPIDQTVAWIGQNTAFGANALQNLSTTAPSDFSNKNTAIGFNALNANSTGVGNTAVGVNALNLCTVNFNTAIGVNALLESTAIENTAIGAFALENGSGINNTAVGANACRGSISTGNVIGNTAIGHDALVNITTGTNNTALGRAALNTNSNFTNATGVGYQANVTTSNQVRIGNTSVTSVTCQTNAWSDERDKADIRDTVLGLEFVKSLRPVDFKWDFREDYRPEMPVAPSGNATEGEKAAYEIAKAQWLEDCKWVNLVHDGTHKRNRFHHGLIAQEVKTLIEQTGVDFGGFQDHTIKGGDEVMTIGYTELIGPMIKAIQELSAEVASLKAQLNP
jgi:hypothetical protein